MDKGAESAIVREPRSSLRVQELPKRVRWLRAAIFLAMATSLGIEFFSRHIRSSWTDAVLTAKLLSLFALLFLCASAIYLIFLLDRRYVLKSMVTSSIAAVLISQMFAILREFPEWTAAHPSVRLWIVTLEGPLLLAGVVLLLTTFYLALLDTVTAKALLRIQGAELRRQIVERKGAQEKLSESRDQLRQLSAHVERIRESERARMAREIHDEFGQTLTSLKIDLENLKRQIPITGADASGCHDIISSMKLQIDATVQTTRRLISELHPPILDDLGLVAAVEWLVDDYAKRTGIHCTLNSDSEEIAFKPETSTAVFRIVQECLTNVVRHANATKVDVRLGLGNGGLVLDVRDDGGGFDPENTPAPGRRFGILGMKERLSLLGGEMQIDSEPGEGTRIHVSIPYEAPEGAFQDDGVKPSI